MTFSRTSMARPCTADHTASPRLESCNAAPISLPMASAAWPRAGNLSRLGSCEPEHQPRHRGTLGDKSHIGCADIGDAVGLRSRHLGRLDDILAKFVEAFHAQFDQKGFVIGEMAIGRRMADAGAPRHGPQGQRAQRLFLQDAPRRIEQPVAQIPVMIGALQLGRFALGIVLGVALFVIHALPLRAPWRTYSCRAKRLDVSQRLPPRPSTSA